MRLFLVALLLGTSLGASSLTHVLHETVKTPTGYTKSHQPDAHTKVPLRIYLAQPNLHRLPDMLMNVSHPDSPHYGAHWTPQQVADVFHNEEALDKVKKWLSAHGFALRIVVGRGRKWVGIKNATVHEIQDLFESEYWVYKGPNGLHMGLSNYSVPVDLVEHIDFVLNTPPPQKRGISRPIPIIKQAGQANTESIRDQLEQCESKTTPICLRELYGINYEPVVPQANSYGIVEYTPQAFVQSDLDIFFANFSTYTNFQPPQLVSIVGGVVQNANREFEYNGESDLDLEYGMEIVTNLQNVTLYQVGDLQIGASFNNFLDALDASYCGGDDDYYDAIYPDTYPGGYSGPADCGDQRPTNVISTSYGYNEADLSAKYMERQCLEYAKLGVMGVSVLHSSGDYGVAGNYNLCVDDHGYQTPRGQRYNPSFPSSCPWVTSVGATMVMPQQSRRSSDTSAAAAEYPPRYVEKACEKVIHSGGGFSNVFEMPNYQSKLVDGYLQAHTSSLLYGGIPGYRWNNTGTRAYPDISANGANYVVVVNGRLSMVYGTSASAPVIGGIITLINDARIATGRGTIGFANPALYHPYFKKGLHDIINGSNAGCGSGGFHAVPGWDPVTGMGTPNFPVLMDRWLTFDENKNF